MQLDQFKEWIAKRIAKEGGGQVKFASRHGLDPASLSLVLGGKREPSKEFAEALGWEKTSTYTKRGNSK